jgi:hypothetical protein
VDWREHTKGVTETNCSFVSFVLSCTLLFAASITAS